MNTPQFDTERESTVWRQALDLYMRDPTKASHNSNGQAVPPTQRAAGAVAFADFVLAAYRDRSPEAKIRRDFERGGKA